MFMKNFYSFSILGLALTFSPAFGDDATGHREIEITVQKVNEETHWMPEKIEAKPGEKVKLIVKHELPGGFDFHGLENKQLKLDAKIDRNQPQTFDVTMPKKAGEYKLACKFHFPKHKPAIVVVK